MNEKSCKVPTYEDYMAEKKQIEEAAKKGNWWAKYQKFMRYNRFMRSQIRPPNITELKKGEGLISALRRLEGEINSNSPVKLFGDKNFVNKISKKNRIKNKCHIKVRQLSHLGKGLCIGVKDNTVFIFGDKNPFANEPWGKKIDKEMEIVTNRMLRQGASGKDPLNEKGEENGAEQELIDDGIDTKALVNGFKKGLKEGMAAPESEETCQ